MGELWPDPRIGIIACMKETPPEEREIVTHRLIDAPRALVFRAFSEPEHLARWWGPDGFTNTFAEFDFRPGGHWRFTMHGPDGSDHDNHSVFEEITSERIVFQHLGPVHEFQMTILLEERDGKTAITVRMLNASAELHKQIEPFVRVANEQNLDRLEAELASMRTS